MRKSVAIAIIIEVGTCRDILPWSFEEDDLVMREIILGHTCCPVTATRIGLDQGSQSLQKRQLKCGKSARIKPFRQWFACLLGWIFNSVSASRFWNFKGWWPGCSENWIKDLLPDPGKGREHDDWLQHLLFSTDFNNRSNKTQHAKHSMKVIASIPWKGK